MTSELPGTRVAACATHCFGHRRLSTGKRRRRASERKPSSGRAPCRDRSLPKEAGPRGDTSTHPRSRDPCQGRRRRRGRTRRGGQQRPGGGEGVADGGRRPPPRAPGGPVAEPRSLPADLRVEAAGRSLPSRRRPAEEVRRPRLGSCRADENPTARPAQSA